MTQQVVNGGATGDTTNIDDAIAYLESPEYLRMIAREQNESPYALLSRSTTQPWISARGAETQTALASGDRAMVMRDRPWSSPLMTGDVVRVEYLDTEAEDADNYRVTGPDGRTWWVPTDALSPLSEPETPSESLSADDVVNVPQRAVQGFDAPTAPTGAVASVFGVRWNSHNNLCECASCAPVPVVPRPTRTVSRRLKLRVRDPWWEFRHPLHDRREFDTYGSLRGRTRPESESCGYLADKSAAAYALWRADQSKIDYVVYSYRTPIAWHVTHGTDVSEWVFPDVKYSATTTAQQTKIRTALEANENQYLVDSVRYLREG